MYIHWIHDTQHRRLYWKDICIYLIPWNFVWGTPRVTRCIRYELFGIVLNPISIVVVNIHEMFCIFCVGITPTRNPDIVLKYFTERMNAYKNTNIANNYIYINILHDSKKVRWEVWFVEDHYRHHNEKKRN